MKPKKPKCAMTRQERLVIKEAIKYAGMMGLDQLGSGNIFTKEQLSEQVYDLCLAVHMLEKSRGKLK